MPTAVAGCTTAKTPSPPPRAMSSRSRGASPGSRKGWFRKSLPSLRVQTWSVRSERIAPLSFPRTCMLITIATRPSGPGTIRCTSTRHSAQAEATSSKYSRMPEWPRYLRPLTASTDMNSISGWQTSSAASRSPALTASENTRTACSPGSPMPGSMPLRAGLPWLQRCRSSPISTPRIPGLDRRRGGPGSRTGACGAGSWPRSSSPTPRPARTGPSRPCWSSSSLGSCVEPPSRRCRTGTASRSTANRAASIGPEVLDGLHVGLRVVGLHRADDQDRVVRPLVPDRPGDLRRHAYQVPGGDVEDPFLQLELQRAGHDEVDLLLRLVPVAVAPLAAGLGRHAPPGEGDLLVPEVAGGAHPHLAGIVAQYVGDVVQAADGPVGRR